MPNASKVLAGVNEKGCSLLAALCSLLIFEVIDAMYKILSDIGKCRLK